MRPFLLAGALAIALSACDGDPDPVQYGPTPELPEPQRGLLPAMKIPKPANWGNERPTVPQGYKIEAIATDLKIPRQTLVLPNGDILIRRKADAPPPPPLGDLQNLLPEPAPEPALPPETGGNEITL